MPSFTIEYLWADNSGKTATCSISTGPGASYAGAEVLAATLAPLLQAVSDAALLGYTISTPNRVPSPPQPGLQSDVKRAALLFYRDGNNCASIYVPSPSLLLAETSGFYAGIRITRERLAVLTLLAQVEALPAGTLDAVGRPYGSTFTVGGITKL